MSNFAAVNLATGWLGVSTHARAAAATVQLHCESKKQSAIILSITSPNVDRFSKLVHCRFLSEYSTKPSLTIPPHLKRVAVLPCETSVSENYRKFDACVVVNDKSQGSVATRLRCGGLFSYYFTTYLF